MTREEAKEVFINRGFVNGLFDGNKWRESVVIISKWLEQEPCEDAISRQAVLDAIDVKAWEFCDYLISKGRNDEQKPVSHFADNLRECVREDLPSVTPQPKTGHWIEEFNDLEGEVRFTCSSCGKYQLFGTDNCYNCGAKMVQPQESEADNGNDNN